MKFCYDGRVGWFHHHYRHVKQKRLEKAKIILCARWASSCRRFVLHHVCGACRALFCPYAQTHDTAAETRTLLSVRTLLDYSCPTCILSYQAAPLIHKMYRPKGIVSASCSFQVGWETPIIVEKKSARPPCSPCPAPTVERMCFDKVHGHMTL